MDQRDSYCPYLPLGELTVRGTGLTKNMGKEDPFELNSSQTLWSDAKGIVISGSRRRTWNTTTFVVVLLNFYIEWALCAHFKEQLWSHITVNCNGLITLSISLLGRVLQERYCWLAEVPPRINFHRLLEPDNLCVMGSIKMTLSGGEFGWGGT
jgi:hypothetical protein